MAMAQGFGRPLGYYVNGVDPYGNPAPKTPIAPQNTPAPPTQGFVPNSDPLHPLGPIGGPQAPAAPQSTPTPTSAPDWLTQLQQRVNSYDPSAGINDAFNQQTQLAQQAMGDQWSAEVGGRGLLPSDNTSQDLRAVLTSKIMAPIAAQRASALAGAQQQGLQQQMSLAGMLSDRERAQQAMQLQQQQMTYAQQQDAANRAFQQSQFDAQQRSQQQAFDYQKQQDLLRNQGTGLTDAAGQFKPPQSPMNPFAPQPSAPVSGWTGNTGSSGSTLADVLAAQGYAATGGMPSGLASSNAAGMSASGGGAAQGGGVDSNTSAFQQWQQRNAATPFKAPEPGAGRSNAGGASPNYAAGPSSAPSPGAMNPSGSLWSALKPNDGFTGGGVGFGPGSPSVTGIGSGISGVGAGSLGGSLQTNGGSGFAMGSPPNSGLSSRMGLGGPIGAPRPPAPKKFNVG